MSSEYSTAFKHTHCLPYMGFNIFLSYLCLSKIRLWEHRTLWGKCEQAALNCHIAKALLMKYHITAYRPWHVAKQGLSLYCLKVLNSLTA